MKTKLSIGILMAQKTFPGIEQGSLDADISKPTMDIGSIEQKVSCRAYSLRQPGDHRFNALRFSIIAID